MGYHIPPLEVRKITGGWGAYPPSVTTTEDLKLFPNYTDATATLELRGAGGVVIDTASGEVIIFKYGGAAGGYFGVDASQFTIGTYDNRDITLSPAGTGKVKFGTHTGSGDVVCNGTIATLDIGGNPRKLMTTA